MKIYISGKITGDSGYIEKFKEAEKKISAYVAHPCTSA